MKRFLGLCLVLLLACQGADSLAPAERRVGTLATDTVLTFTPVTVAALVNDLDSVIGKVTINGSTCGGCAIAFRNLDSTRLQIVSTFKPTGQTKLNGLVVKSLAVGTPGIRAGYMGRADTTVWTITTAPPVGVQAAWSDDFVNSFSVQLHLGQGGIYDQFTTIVKPRLLELGVRHIRERMFNDAGTQAQQQDLAANGIQMTAGCWPINGNTADASHCLAYANAYGTGVIDALDGWNEVDGQGLADWKTSWVAWQQTMFDAYNADPTWQNRPVLANSITSTASTTDLFTTKGNQSSRIDAGNMHDYPGGGNTPEGGVEDSWVNANTSLAQPKPLWTTETGYHTCTGAVGNSGACGGIGVSELAQAKYTGRIYAEFWRRGRVRTNLYELLDEGTTCGSAGTSREDCWGLVRFDGSVKPSFTTVKSLIALLADPGTVFAAGKLDYTLTGSHGHREDGPAAEAGWALRAADLATGEHVQPDHRDRHHERHGGSDPQPPLVHAVEDLQAAARHGGTDLGNRQQRQPVSSG
jgi:hypothetical protein